MPAAWCLANPEIGEREVAGAPLAHARRVFAPRAGARAASPGDREANRSVRSQGGGVFLAEFG